MKKQIINIQSKENATIHNVAEKIAALAGVKAVYLFGSHATGTAHAQSDIDLCIISDQKNKSVERRILKYAKEKIDISLFSNLALPIQFRVLREGKALAINDKDFVDRLKIHTLKMYLDFKPMINRYLMERFGCMI